MPRAKLRREPCDCLDCREPGPAGGTAAGGSAAIARQEPPPKSLVLCLTGALQSEDILREAEVPHLDSAVRAGWAGLLACRADGLALPLQLLGLQRTGEAPAQNLADRFKQLRAVLLTDTEEVADAGELAGCYAVHLMDSGSGKGSGGNSGGDPLCPAWQPPEQLAASICRLLHVRPLPAAGPAAAPDAAADTAPALAAVFAAAGLGGDGKGAGEGGKEEEEEGDDVVDMLLLVLDATKSQGGTRSRNSSSGGGNGAGSGDGGSGGAAALDWGDRLVRCLNQVPGFREAVLLSLVLGPGQQPLPDSPLFAQGQALLQPGAPPAAPAASQSAAGRPAVVPAAVHAVHAVPAADCPPVRRPLQSYQFAGLDRVAVDAGRPALVVHRLPAVIRVDRASQLSLAHIAAHGGAGCILAERLLPEVAYKLGRAPKYGA